MAEILINPSEERRILDFRRIGFRDVVVLGRYSYAKAHLPLATHSHNKMLEICHIESGEQTYLVGNERFDLSGGDVFITFPGERHGTGQSPEGKGVLFWMLLNTPEPDQHFLSLTPADARQLVDCLLGMPSRHFRGNPALKQTLYQIFKVYGNRRNPLRQIDLQNLMLRFLLDVLRASRQSQPHISPVIRQVQQSIANNLDQALTVRQLAHLAHLSQSRFKARFKEEVGIPPADYVIWQKLERAKVLLRSGQHTIAQVAAHIGLSSSQYFATVFKRYTGTTPSRYRASSS